MKRKPTAALLLLLATHSATLYTQNFTQLSDKESVVYPIEKNDRYNPCLTPQDYQALENQCAENIKLLGLDKNIHKSALTTPLNWPIRAASGFTDCDYYFIGAYVDQNTAAGVFQDFDCGTNTYDGHHGTDIAAWPYGFYKMDNNQVEVIAAAPGTIIQKADGNFDRNCAANTLTANSIIIQHADGSQALYWHLKKNSLTSKIVGQTVAAGEYLGVVGSSGSASGPHLHFEVWTGSTNTTYNDPFSGPCNTLNAASWWAAQRPHTNPAVIKVSVNTTDIVLPGCPTTETPHESDVFAIPFQGAGLSPGYAKFYLFIRDDVAGMTADCRILKPNGTTFNNWTYASTANNKIAIKGYSKLLPTIPGTYTLQATYNGITCSRSFEVTQVSGTSSLFVATSFQVLQNPASGTCTLVGDNIDNGDYKLTLINVAGQTVLEDQVNITDNSMYEQFPVSALPNGIYFLTIDGQKVRVVQKMIKRY